MKNLTRSETARILLAHDQYTIVTHRRPDGDTIGSSAALCVSDKGTVLNNFGICLAVGEFVPAPGRLTVYCDLVGIGEGTRCVQRRGRGSISDVV